MASPDFEPPADRTDILRRYYDSSGEVGYALLPLTPSEDFYGQVSGLVAAGGGDRFGPPDTTLGASGSSEGDDGADPNTQEIVSGVGRFLRKETDHIFLVGPNGIKET